MGHLWRRLVRSGLDLDGEVGAADLANMLGALT